MVMLFMIAMCLQSIVGRWKGWGLAYESIGRMNPWQGGIVMPKEGHTTAGDGACDHQGKQAYQARNSGLTTRRRELLLHV